MGFLVSGHALLYEEGIVNPIGIRKEVVYFVRICETLLPSSLLNPNLVIDSISWLKTGWNQCPLIGLSEKWMGWTNSSCLGVRCVPRVSLNTPRTV